MTQKIEPGKVIPHVYPVESKTLFRCSECNSFGNKYSFQIYLHNEQFGRPLPVKKCDDCLVPDPLKLHRILATLKRITKKT